MPFVSRTFLAHLLFLIMASFVGGASPTDRFAYVYWPPDIATAALSPDGRHIACVARGNGKMSVVVIDVDDAKARPAIELTNDPFTARLSARILWLNAQRFLVHYSRDMLAMDLDGKNVTRIVDWAKREWTRDETSTSGNSLAGRRTVRIVALPPNDRDFVHVEGVARASSITTFPEEHAWFKIHLGTGAVQTVAKEELTGSIIHDQQGRPRIWRSPTGKPHVYQYRSADVPPGKWRPLQETFPPPDGPRFTFGMNDFFGQRSIPLGFDFDPNTLYVASNVDRDTYGIYAIDVRTGQRTTFKLEDSTIDLISPLASGREAALVFDPHRQKLAGVRILGMKLTAKWVDDELAAVQTRIEAMAPAESAVIEGWDTKRERFLVLLSSRGDAGGYAIYFRTEDKLRRYLPRWSRREPYPVPRTTPWAFRRDNGELLAGTLTVPAKPKRTPIPIVINFGSAEWERVLPEAGTEVAAFAQMGYAVLEVNHRGVVGLGLKHWLSGRGRFDAVAAEDVMLAVDRIAPKAGLDAGKVVVYGFGFGGLLALRTAELQASRVAGVVAVSPTLDLVDWSGWTFTFGENSRLRDESRRWFFGETASVRRAHSPLHRTDALRRPVLLAAPRDLGLQPDFALADFRGKLKKAGNEATYVPLTDPFESPSRYSEAFTAIETFLGKYLSPEEP
jgi:dipeptidyl aminopeptidase/acylaminoacyl peptidase